MAYGSGSACAACDVNRYLLGNRCLAVAEDGRISNCLYYRSSVECLACRPGYMVSNNACVLAIAANCLTYASQRACASCAAGFGLSASGDITSCVLASSPNCEAPDAASFGPNFTCLTCFPGFYVSPATKLCSKVEATISGCLYYADALTCAKCLTPKVVAADGRSCLGEKYVTDLADPHCSRPRQQLSCSLCQLGNLAAAGGACTPCRNSSQAQGCLQCNPQDDSKCLICLSGFRHNKDGQCVAEAEQPKSPSPNTTTYTNKAGRRPLGALAAALLWLLLSAGI